MEYSLKSTSSGIKQIGIIELLLKYRILNKNSFLIIDEPEINLHPEWQVKLAEILVLLSKELNITLFINSHSPQFIEAIELYSARLLLNDTKFFLSEENEMGKFNISEILRKDILLLYENLGEPYYLLSEIRADNISKDLF